MVGLLYMLQEKYLCTVQGSLRYLESSYNAITPCSCLESMPYVPAGRSPAARPPIRSRYHNDDEGCRSWPYDLALADSCDRDI